ncbi:hypothetical protein ACHAP5_005217 [Fusarium lateritium]
MTPNSNDLYPFHRQYEKFLRDHPPEELSRAIYRQRLIGGDDIERSRLQWLSSVYFKITPEWQRVLDQFPYHLQHLARNVVDQVGDRIPVSCPQEYNHYQGSVFNTLVLEVLVAYPKPVNEDFERLVSESRVPKQDPVGTGRPRPNPSRLEEEEDAAAPPAPPAPPSPELTLRELVATSVPDQEKPSRTTGRVAPGPPKPTDHTDPIPEPAWMKRLLESDNEDNGDDNDDDNNEKQIRSDIFETDQADDVRPRTPSFLCASNSSSHGSPVYTPSSSTSP